MGRSGTQFLSRVLDTSPDWVVRHEPYDGFQYTRAVRARFHFRSTLGNYGEVNSYLRLQIIALRVDYKAIILRDPIQIFQSMYNRGKPHLDHLNESLHCLDVAIQSGIPTIAFSRMTTDATYLEHVTHEAGILSPAQPNLRPSNASFPQEMPEQLQVEARDKLDWFSNKYWRLW